MGLIHKRTPVCAVPNTIFGERRTTPRLRRKGGEDVSTSNRTPERQFSMSTNLFDLKFEGNLGFTPELRHTKGGKPVCDLRVAVNRDYVGADGKKVENTHWYKVTVWGRQAETCAQYLEKGRMVRVIVGRVASEAWSRYDEDTDTSEIVHRPVFHASRVDFLGGASRVSEGVMHTEDFGDDFGYSEMDTAMPTQPVASIPATPAPKGKRKSAKRGASATEVPASADFAGLDAIPF